LFCPIARFWHAQLKSTLYANERLSGQNKETAWQIMRIAVADNRNPQ
jgi:hypothetical protein